MPSKPQDIRERQFYDYFEQRWVPLPQRWMAGDATTRASRRVAIRNIAVHNNCEPSLPLAKLYALLLIKTLCQADPELMQEFGEQVAKLTKRD